MKAFFYGVWYSLTTRLILLFLGLGVCGVLLFLLIFKTFWQVQPPPQAYPIPFLTYLSKEIGAQPQISRIEAVMEETIYTLRIDSPKTSWTTDDAIPRLSQLRQDEVLSDNTFYYRADDDARYLVLKRPTISYIFGYRFRNDDRDVYQVMMFAIPLTAILVLLISYFTVFKLFKPIRWIRRGALRIGQGDLAYRIPYERNDELGQLVGVVNQMAHDLEQIFDSKRQLLLAISHELRSPLTRMKLNIALMDGSAATTRLTDDIDEMRDIIEGLLDSERLQGRHTALDKKRVQLEPLIASIVAEYDSDGGVYFKPSVQSQEQKDEMQLDVARMQFLLRNLINNALKYTEPDERRIVVDVRKEDEQVNISVTDNGIGIEASHLAHLFSPFYRADQSRGRKTGGVGLGLYLCDLIVKAHGGSISVGSDVGKGSCFEVVLPLFPSYRQD
jgi:signal transduction histidine kinase